MSSDQWRIGLRSLDLSPSATLKIPNKQTSTMLLVDVHAHLHLCENPQDVISRATLAGVKHIITTGLDEESNTKTLALSRGSTIVHAAIGIYPSSIKKNWEEQLSTVTETIKKNKKDIVAIGEVGIDQHHTEETAPTLDTQKKVFQEFITLSEKTKLPLVVHSRKAEEIIIDLLTSSNARAVLHSFGGNKKLQRKAIDEGLSFSIPTNCSRSTHYQGIIQQSPLSQLLTETDAPYQSPIIGIPSEPAHVARAITTIATLKKLTPEETANNIFMNYTRFFQ